MSQADVVRSMKIKTNTLKRLQNEFGYYLAEKDKEQSRVDRLRTESADPHDLKQAVRVGGGGARGAGAAQQAQRGSLRGLPCCASDLSARPARTQENVLAESAMMIPETRARLEAALSDLQGFVVRGAAAPQRLRLLRATLCFARRNPAWDSCSRELNRNPVPTAPSTADRQRPGRGRQRGAGRCTRGDLRGAGHLQLMPRHWGPARHWGPTSMCSMCLALSLAPITGGAQDAVLIKNRCPADAGIKGVRGTVAGSLFAGGCSESVSNATTRCLTEMRADRSIPAHTAKWVQRPASIGGCCNAGVQMGLAPYGAIAIGEQETHSATRKARTGGQKNWLGSMQNC
jgi:tubulin-specific chaperone A